MNNVRSIKRAKMKKLAKEIMDATKTTQTTVTVRELDLSYEDAIVLSRKIYDHDFNAVPAHNPETNKTYLAASKARLHHDVLPAVVVQYINLQEMGVKEEYMADQIDYLVHTMCEDCLRTHGMLDDVS